MDFLALLHRGPKTRSLEISKGVFYFGLFSIDYALYVCTEHTELSIPQNMSKVTWQPRKFEI